MAGTDVLENRTMLGIEPRTLTCPVYTLVIVMYSNSLGQEALSSEIERPLYDEVKECVELYLRAPYIAH